MRRAAGPFAVRCAVESDVTAPAVADIMAELGRIADDPVEDAELDAARDYLIGVFPLRFETSAQVAGALSGLVVHGLPDDELDRYRPAIAAVGADEVRTAAARSWSLVTCRSSRGHSARPATARSRSSATTVSAPATSRGAG